MGYIGYTPKFMIILCLIFRYCQTNPCMGEAMYGSWFCQGKEKSSFPWCLLLLVAVLAVLFLAVAVGLSSPDMQLRPVPKDRWGEGGFSGIYILNVSCLKSFTGSGCPPYASPFASAIFLCNSLWAPLACLPSQLSTRSCRFQFKSFKTFCGVRRGPTGSDLQSKFATAKSQANPTRSAECYRV